MPLKIKQRLYQKHVAYKLNYIYIVCNYYILPMGVYRLKVINRLRWPVEF